MRKGVLATNFAFLSRVGRHEDDENVDVAATIPAMQPSSAELEQNGSGGNNENILNDPYGGDFTSFEEVADPGMYDGLEDEEAYEQQYTEQGLEDEEACEQQYADDGSAGEPEDVSFEIENQNNTVEEATGSDSGREGIEVWNDLMSSFREQAGPLQEQMCNLAVETAEGKSSAAASMKAIVEMSYGIASGTKRSARPLAERTLPRDIVRISGKTRFRDADYTASISVPYTRPVEMVRAMIHDYIEFSLSSLRCWENSSDSLCQSAPCPTLSEFGSTDSYREIELKCVNKARSVAEPMDLLLPVLFTVFQDEAALNIGGRTVNPVVLTFIGGDTYARRHRPLTESLVSVFPDLSKSGVTRTGPSGSMTIHFESCHTEVQRVLNRVLLIELLREVCRRFIGATGRMMLPSGRTLCFATDILAFIMDSPAKLQASGTFKDNCPICEDGRRLPAEVTLRNEIGVVSARNYANENGISDSERKHRVTALAETGLHPDHGPLHGLVDTGELGVFAAMESMHAEDNCNQDYLYLVYLGIASDPSNTELPALDSKKRRLAVSPEHGMAYFVKTGIDGCEEFERPSKSRQKNSDESKATRLQKAKKHVRCVAFYEAATSCDRNTKSFLDKDGKMFPRNFGVDGALVTLMRRDPLTGEFTFFKDQRIALLCVQVGILMRSLCKGARDVAAGLWLPRLRRIADLLRCHWLKLCLLLRVADTNISTHFVIQHFVATVERFGPIGKLDSAARESGHKSTKLIASHKTNYQNNRRVEGVVVETGDFSKGQILQSALSSRIVGSWIRRRIVTQVCEPVILDGTIGVDRRPETHFSITILDWKFQDSCKAIAEFFVNQPLDFGSVVDYNDDIGNANPTYAALTGHVFDAGRRELSVALKQVNRDLLPISGLNNYGIMTPGERIVAFGARRSADKSDMSRDVLSWMEDGKAPNRPGCKAKSCMGCRDGWGSSTIDSANESYGLPLGFRKLKNGPILAYVAELELDHGYEPALRRFANAEGTVQEMSDRIYGAFCFKLNPIVRVIKDTWICGRSEIMLNVSAERKHFVQYRRYEDVNM